MPSKRVRIEDTRLKTWKQVDETLRGVGELQMAVEAKEAGMNAEIDAIKAETAEAVRPLQEQIRAKELAVQQFTTESRETMGAKTKTLTFGQVGFRQSTKIVIRQEKDVIAKLRDMGLKECIRIKESVDREALREKGEAIIAALGTVQRKIQDVFWYEVDREKIEAL